MGDVIKSTTQYGVVTPQDDAELLSQWNNLIAGCAAEWAQLVGVPAVTTAVIGPDGEESDDDDVDPGDEHEYEADEVLE